MAKMDDKELEAIVGAELTDAQTYIDDEISPYRAIATDYYLGRPFGNEVEGRSQMVSQDVRDTVNAIMPSLMRVFMSTDKPVEFVPTSAEDVALAEQATDYANYILTKENDGFTQIYSAFKDSLIRKCGFIKVWWEEKERVKIADYDGLDEQTVQVLMAEPDTDVKITGESIREEQAVDQMTGQPFMLPVMVYSATVKKTLKEGKVCVMAVPPEEFLMDRRARSKDDATLIAHRRMMTVSDLVQMGYDYDEVTQYVTEDEFSQNPEYIARTQFTQYEQVTGADMSQRRVQYCEAYIKIDVDGDGVSELMKVCTLGNWKVVHKEPCDIIPFALFPYDPEPHLSPIEATSAADVTMDIQRLKSDVWRTSLDSLAQSIMPRTVVIEGQVEMQDVLNNEVGAIIRAKSLNAIQELPTQNVSQQAFPMLAYIDNVKEARTGMSQASMGLDPDALQSTTKAAVAATISASQGKIELATRILANGFKDLFKIMLHLITTHQDKPKMVRMRNQWVPIDPRVWNSDMDVSINIALGQGTTDEKIQTLAMVAQKQEQILAQMGPNNPLVTLAQYSNTLTKMLELAGHKDTSGFFNKLPKDFQLPPPPPPPVDPNSQAAQLLAQVEREKSQAKLQIDTAKLQFEQQAAASKQQFDTAQLQADTQLAAAKLQLDRDKMEADFARQRLELEVQKAKTAAELRLKEADAVLKQLTTLKGLQRDEEEAYAQTGQIADQARQEGMLVGAIQSMNALIAENQPGVNDEPR